MCVSRVLRAKSFLARCGARRKDGHGFSATTVRTGRFNAAWLLLPVEPGVGVAARDFLFHDPFHAAVVRAQTARLTVQLDLRAVWSVHRGVRHDARDGSMESVACRVLAGWRAKGHRRHGFVGYGHSAGAANAVGAGASPRWPMDAHEGGAGSRNPRAARTGN